MSKNLSEMSLEELWELFPIVLTEHQLCWKNWYKSEEKELIHLLSSTHFLRISHIGSTAVETIWAKPIIDILIEISKEDAIERVAEIVTQNGYICMCQSDNRKSFNKGYTKNGFDEKVFHLHLRYVGDNSELYFRDYLNEHLCTAKAYEELKLGLWKRYEHNRDEYTESKTEFISKYTELARQTYGSKY